MDFRPSDLTVVPKDEKKHDWKRKGEREREIEKKTERQREMGKKREREREPRKMTADAMVSL